MHQHSGAGDKDTRELMESIWKHLAELNNEINVQNSKINLKKALLLKEDLI